jgi:hypothetical protein
MVYNFCEDRINNLLSMAEETGRDKMPDGLILGAHACAILYLLIP